MANTNNPLIANSVLFTATDLAEVAVAIKASSAVVYQIEVDNTANAAASYLRLWNTGTVTVGTTAPDFVLLIPASVSRALTIPQGLTFGTALTAACVTTAGTAGLTGPTSDVIVRIVYV